MRIVYVSYLHPAVAPGGAQQVAYELFQASLRKGHDAYFIAALEQHHDAVYGKPGAPIVPVQGAEREYFYFPQNYDFLHLSVGDWRSTRFPAPVDRAACARGGALPPLSPGRCRIVPRRPPGCAQCGHLPDLPRNDGNLHG